MVVKILTKKLKYLDGMGFDHRFLLLYIFDRLQNTQRDIRRNGNLQRYRNNGLQGSKGVLRRLRRVYKFYHHQRSL